jgi:hypothetical protein
MQNLFLFLMNLPDCFLGLKLSTKGTSVDLRVIFDPGSDGAGEAQTFTRLCPLTDNFRLKYIGLNVVVSCACELTLLHYIVIHVVSAVNKF